MLSLAWNWTQEQKSTSKSMVSHGTQLWIMIDSDSSDLFFPRHRTMMDVPRRPNMQEMARKCISPENHLNKRLGMSLPNLAERSPMDTVRKTSLKKIQLNGGKKSPSSETYLL